MYKCDIKLMCLTKQVEVTDNINKTLAYYGIRLLPYIKNP